MRVDVTHGAVVGITHSVAEPLAAAKASCCVMQVSPAESERERDITFNVPFQPVAPSPTACPFGSGECGL
jgi:hypothetical protein